MINLSVLALSASVGFATMAFADPSIEYSAPSHYPFARSALTGEAVTIPCYGHRLFPIRVYTTPQEGPLYNVPPYAVISPY